MKKLFTLAIAIIAACSLLAQPKNEGQNFKWVSEQWGIGPVAGQFHPDLTAMNDQLEIWKGNDKDLFYEGLRGYGITIVEPMNVSRGGLFDGSFSYAFFMPAKVSINNDSMTFRLQGWHFMYSIFGKDVIPGKVVALVLSPGWDFGSFKMISAVRGSGTLSRNFFVAPFGRAELRFVFGPIMLGARGIYHYDITKSTWKNKSGPAFDLPGTRNTGFSTEFFVGFGHVHFQ
jgi:hypothetical protein